MPSTAYRRKVAYFSPILSAAWYFGPGATHCALGELVFAAALDGKTAQIMGKPDRLHSYSYTPDVAAGLIVLGALALLVWRRARRP